MQTRPHGGNNSLSLLVGEFIGILFYPLPVFTLTLCSDMGLGKTLQSICIIAGDHHSKATTFKVMLLNETV